MMTTKLNLILISVAYFIYAFFLSNYLLITSVGLTFSLYISLLFLFKLGKEIPLIELIILIACFQWIVGAKIGYNIGKVHYKYYMYVEEVTYMNYVVPGVILFYLGLSVFNLKILKNDLENYFDSYRESLTKVAKVILLIGLSSFFLSALVKIPQISFVFYLANLLIYVGAAHYMLLFPKRRNAIFAVAMLFMFLNSLQTGFFHDLIISAVFLVFFLFSTETGYFRKLTIITVGFSALYVLQVVKSEYRSIIWKSQGNVSAVAAFFEVLEEEFAPGNEAVNTVNLKTDAEAKDQNNINTRLNQGWIISKIMDNVPRNEDFLGGETITEAIKSSILPRFLFPNKKGAEQALINFRQISGIDLNKGTSMGLSVIGEFYGNYGVNGGWVAMFLYGLFLSQAIKYLVYGLGKGSPLMLLWFILFFFQVVKAETDFIKIINHLVKSIVFFALFLFLMKAINVNILMQANTDEGE